MKQPLTLPIDPSAPPGIGFEDLLAAVKAWRTAEVHHAAITLEMRDGDELLAKTRLADATRELRIAADKYINAANDEASNGTPKT